MELIFGCLKSPIFESALNYTLYQSCAYKRGISLTLEKDTPSIGSRRLKKHTHTLETGIGIISPIGNMHWKSKPHWKQALENLHWKQALETTHTHTLEACAGHVHPLIIGWLGWAWLGWAWLGLAGVASGTASI